MQITDNMCDTSKAGYKRKRILYKIRRGITVLVIFPLLICLYFAGGAYSMEGAGLGLYKREDAAPVLPSLPVSGGVLSPMSEELSVIPAEDAERLPDNMHQGGISDLPEGHLPIEALDLSMELEGERMPFRNSSKYGDIDYRDYIDIDHPVCREDEYSVLVIHTHTSEAYTPDGVMSDDPDDPYLTRSDDPMRNVVAVGSEFCRVLEENGIKTLHHTKAIDSISDYSEAYQNSAAIIKYYLERYPTIKYVFDIHRDAVVLSTGEKAKCLCVHNGNPAAQVMLVVGTDSLGQDHEDWENNLSLAIRLQLSVYGECDKLMRSINIKQGAFNQHYSERGLLLEFGSDGNTLAEALYSAAVVAEHLTKIIK